MIGPGLGGSLGSGADTAALIPQTGLTQLGAMSKPPSFSGPVSSSLNWAWRSVVEPSSQGWGKGQGEDGGALRAFCSWVLRPGRSMGSGARLCIQILAF